MEYNVKIIRCKRKSLSLSVSFENDIILRCPKLISEKAVTEFLESKKQWLDKVISKNTEKRISNGGILEYKEIFVNGRKLPLIIENKNAITGNAVYVKNLKNLKNLYISELSESFFSFVKEISEWVNLHATQIKFRHYKSRWGCCDRKRIITFNYLLLMLPIELQRYVIIHELCHTVYFNHSPSFWKLVASFLPDYKALRNALKNFDFIIKLY